MTGLPSQRVILIVVKLQAFAELEVTLFDVIGWCFCSELSKTFDVRERGAVMMPWPRMAEGRRASSAAVFKCMLVLDYVHRRVDGY